MRLRPSTYTTRFKTLMPTMDWNNYLLEEKAPGGPIAHLGVLDGTINA